MKSVILCEGLTDCLFIQYYLKTVYHWQDGNSRANIKFMRWNRIFGTMSRKRTHKIDKF